MQPSQGSPDIPLVDVMTAPDVLVSGVSGLSLINGVVTVTLENVRCDHTREPPKLERLVVARLGLPIPAAQALLLALNEFLANHGVNPLVAARETCQ